MFFKSLKIISQRVINSGYAKKKVKQKELKKILITNLSKYYIIKKKRWSKIVTKYKIVKSIDFLRVKYRYQLVVRLKAIENIMRFFYLFIFCTSHF